MSSLDVELSAQRIRLGAQNFAKDFMALVELTAEEIAAQTSDPVVRHNALVWKVNAIPAIQVAMYQPDPLVSYVEGWTLLVQMRQYFETGDGKDLFGDQQYLAIEALDDGERRIREGVEALREELGNANLEQFVYRWADQNPLTNDRFLRRSPTVAVAELLADGKEGGLSTLGSMVEMAENAQQMALVLASYAPKQVMWQSELMIEDVLDTASVAPMLDAIDDMEVVRAATAFMTIAPQLIAEERAAVFQEIARERLAMMREIERQREETQIQIAEVLAAERAEISAEIARERAAIFAEMQGLTANTFGETRSLLDHLMLQAGLGLFGTALLVLIGLVLLRRRESA
jgi:hypothetical protein